MVAYSFKQRFVKPIEVGLSSVSLSFDPPPKRQTIRAHGKRRHARPGEELQLYYGMRTKQCRLIGRARCISVEPIKIEVFAAAFQIYVGGKNVDREAMAQEDGFQDAADMWSFWEREHGIGTFKGVLIRWERL